jgi:hypothetical protein
MLVAGPLIMRNIDDNEGCGLLRRITTLGTFAVASIALVGAACTAQVETATPAVVEDDEVEVSSVPVEIETYPHTEYRGHVVYLVDGRWYYPRGRHWYAYRTEPAPLVRHRSYIQAAPPARRRGREPGEARRVQ